MTTPYELTEEEKEVIDTFRRGKQFYEQAPAQENLNSERRGYTAYPFFQPHRTDIDTEALPKALNEGSATSLHNNVALFRASFAVLGRLIAEGAIDVDFEDDYWRHRFEIYIQAISATLIDLAFHSVI